MSTLYLPAYCTREQVRRALDVKQAAYNNVNVDRALMAGVDAVEELTQRKFFVNNTTRQFDWPNYQYAYPWRLWLDQHEMAGQPTLVTTGSLLPSPIVIPPGNYIMRPVNDGPPFTLLELRRDKNSAFGYNDTPQLDIAITGPFGYWAKTRQTSCLFTSAVGATDATVAVSDGISVGVGDILIADSESMVVVDSAYSDTGITFSGLSTPQASDNQVGVPDGTKFTSGEALQIDSEWILVLSVQGNTLNVKRAYDGSVLTSHTGGTIWARRVLSVLRGQLGTTAATHSTSVVLSINAVPGLIQELALAEAIVWITQEPSAFSFGMLSTLSSSANVVGGTGHGQQREPTPGLGLYDIRQMTMNSKYTRKARTRVI
jgi:hypothetical protein